MATQIKIDKTNANWLTQIQHGNTNTTGQHKYCSCLHAGGYKREFITRGPEIFFWLSAPFLETKVAAKVRDTNL